MLALRMFAGTQQIAYQIAQCAPRVWERPCKIVPIRLNIYKLQQSKQCLHCDVITGVAQSILHALSISLQAAQFLSNVLVSIRDMDTQGVCLTPLHVNYQVPTVHRKA